MTGICLNVPARGGTGPTSSRPWSSCSGRVRSRRLSVVGFERVYDIPERVLPAEVLAAPTPERADAQRELLRRSIRSLGVATARDLRDYYRLPAADCKARIPELVEAGDLLPVTVEGWKNQAFVDPDAAYPASDLAGRPAVALRPGGLGA